MEPAPSSPRLSDWRLIKRRCRKWPRQLLRPVHGKDSFPHPLTLFLLGRLLWRKLPPCHRNACMGRPWAPSAPRPPRSSSWVASGTRHLGGRSSSPSGLKATTAQAHVGLTPREISSWNRLPELLPNLIHRSYEPEWTFAVVLSCSVSCDLLLSVENWHMYVRGCWCPNHLHRYKICELNHVDMLV